MGIFSRRKKHHGDEGVGAVSQPEGDGPVTLADRTAPGGAGSPDTNQGKTEPLAPTDHPEPLAVPDLADMSAGRATAQLGSHPAARPTAPAGSYGGGDAGSAPRGLGGAGAQPDQERPELDTTTSTGRAHGPLKPEQQTSGEAHRAGGLNGRTPDGESIETDTEGGATRMGAAPPDAVVPEAPGMSSGHGETGRSPAPGPGDAPPLGTSETQPKVEGIRLPEG